VLALILLCAPISAQTVQRPNFIIFIADDLGGDDCGAYGNPHVRTPNIDRLAATGMRFDSAFLTCSSCSPSRASILTGRFPHNTGAEQLHWPVPAEQLFFVEPLHDSGYWTASAGKWHLGPQAKSKFDKVAEGRGQWLPTLRARPADRPFFLWLASTDPHRPYKPGAIDPPHAPSDVVVPPYLPDAPETRADLALYYDAIGRLDRDMGEVLTELDRQGIADETCILFISDNGRPFPRCKTTVYDSGIKTPWIVRWPGRVAAGSKCRSLVSSVDIAPTILELASVTRPGTLQGMSIAPLLVDPQATVQLYIFAEHNWHDYTAYDRAVRSSRYKYIRNGYTDLTMSPPADAVKGQTFQAMRSLRDAGGLNAAQSTCFTKPRAVEELYDLQADPHELVNLAGRSDLAQTQRELSQALDAWQRETRDRMPEVRTPDGYDRETGEPLPGGLKPRPSTPEFRAERLP